MPTTTSSKYFKILGAKLNDDTSFDYFIREVADYQGTPLAAANPATPPFTTQPGANELPRGTIVKVVDTFTRTFQVNPTS